MRIVLTVKMIAESKHELIDSFPRTVDEFKDRVTRGIQEYGFAELPPSHVELRWLVQGGSWSPVETPILIKDMTYD
jgi:hypothetical protein